MGHNEDKKHRKRLKGKSYINTASITEVAVMWASLETLVM